MYSSYISGFKDLFKDILSEVTYDGQLSAAAYIILSVVLFVIIGGLAWCFYRAIMAGGQEAPEQHPDEVGDESKQ